ncbi:MAG TPA: DUF1501 domain-containing protein [Pirellulaceae bacterium]|nr:DUF1501 domain-containing protein [Pirellulaceae bacterium]HMO91305.1 DUF1501 domain-containing protein [Pirellulaceae bacterium]HMP68511.1 DUF1501 domain-containing protein [Pirellulaceae bacterium]
MANRRQFIQASFSNAALISLSWQVPSFLVNATRSTTTKNADRILVVIQLSGGNDGLNTVIPYGDDAYYRNRFTLAIDQPAVLKINDYLGLHPALRGFSEMLDLRRLAIVQGVGYPNPNRSHFESMDLWHTAHRIAENRQLGWLGRCLEDHYGLTQELPAIHYGDGKQPLALATRGTPAPSIANLDQFRLNIADRKGFLSGLRQDMSVRRPSDHNPLLGYIHDSAGIALKTSERLENIIETTRELAAYPATRLGRKLAAVSQLMDSGLGTRIYYVTHDGFDTHANQGTTHAALLQELGDAVLAFTNDLDKRGHLERTAIVSFSEFGRRVRENASRGTDHGAAAPLFIAGGDVNSGLLNEHPSLTDLDEGDLKFSIDYRRIYATLLDDWLGIDSESILGGRFPAFDLFS